MDLNEPRDHKPDGDARAPDSHAHDDAGKTPKKRRKVNHACLYCRRSHMTCDDVRPCTRCIKRNIGHLCHDEPREAESRRTARGPAEASTAGDESEAQSDLRSSTTDQAAASMGPPAFDAAAGQAPKPAAFNAAVLDQGAPLQLVRPSPVSGMLPNAPSTSSANVNQFAGFSDAWLISQNHFHDMHSYNPQYMIAPEVNNEFTLLNDFLHNSLIDDDTALPGDDHHPPLAAKQQQHQHQPDGAPAFADGPAYTSASTASAAASAAAMSGASMLPPGPDHGRAISRPASAMPPDKTREYYLQAADPTGNDTSEERMQRVLKAKYEADLLKPFNYVSGYKRLHEYLDSHRVAPTSKQRIQRQLDQFRPKFREKMHALNDMQLVFVEMWFEQTLMEYDRVFASMAVPACCWRRTGEIFRGNKEMAELIHVPVERLRDGKISLHEILTEESVVRYWEEFGTIAFDADHDTLLTACSLKCPDDESNNPIVKCCFSLKIRRDEHKIPSLIVGNFLPHDPPPQ